MAVPDGQPQIRLAGRRPYRGGRIGKDRTASEPRLRLDGFAQLYAFPRWLAAVRESLPAGTPLPNLADVIQDRCEKLLEQVCMPVQG